MIETGRESACGCEARPGAQESVAAASRGQPTLMPGPSPCWQPGRAAGLAQLRAFATRAGRVYAAERNFDTGPGDRHNVSCLSPWIRHRLILEAEVLEAVLRQHTPTAADKFIQELCWRTYWKGWLEMRPRVWRDYGNSVNESKSQLGREPDLRRRWELATTGQTGIDCFDHWATELIETGYLHNHARMWFASIWVFTLDLPWELGADFFLRHLLDGDAAANTLSWRWVAGLQTPGKIYVARADNIARFTGGRFHPQGQLNERVSAPQGFVAIAAAPLPEPVAPVADRRTGLLISDDDLCPETLSIPADTSVDAIAGFTACALRSPWPVSRHVIDFSSASLADALLRTRQRFGVEAVSLANEDVAEQLINWCTDHKLSQLFLPYVPAGVAQDALQPALCALQGAGIRVAQIRRTWDSRLWSHATRGYFAFRKAIRPLLEPGQDSGVQA